MKDMIIWFMLLYLNFLIWKHRGFYIYSEKWRCIRIDQMVLL